MCKIKLHIVGTHGVPAKYGGFETLADYLCQYLGNEYDITVYCNSKKYKDKKSTYYGANLKYLPLDASGATGIIYDVITFFHACWKTDIILYLSPTGSGFITPLKYIFGTINLLVYSVLFCYPLYLYYNPHTLLNLSKDKSLIFNRFIM